MYFYVKEKSIDTSWFEPATFRFVAQHLNHCATAVPYLQQNNCGFKCLYASVSDILHLVTGICYLVTGIWYLVTGIW